MLYILELFTGNDSSSSPASLLVYLEPITELDLPGTDPYSAPYSYVVDVYFPFISISRLPANSAPENSVRRRKSSSGDPSFGSIPIVYKLCLRQTKRRESVQE